ncbi:MAG: SDR family oxidoreductase [Alphaproteobacteria bacterium]|jgi:enoyl-[acyl-carrier-protein] reductase (NADH)|nr:SDR family oxidoreductase [Alphaproteobacteria bacterium]MDP6516273.1 SDR family oxidoreductase [Alphaproteobacteria bacterium]
MAMLGGLDVLIDNAGISGPTAPVEGLAIADSSLGRLVTAQDIANMALFLCPEQARAISGQALPVCADMRKMR